MICNPTWTLDTHKPWVRARCPCGGTFAAGESTTGIPAVIHSLPTCTPYDDLPITDFLVQARVRGAKTLESGGFRPGVERPT